MIHVAEFSPDDLHEIEIQPRQAQVLFGDVVGWFARRAWETGPAWTVRDSAGRVIFCGGFLVIHSQYATGWCVMALGKRHEMVALTHRVRLALDAAPWRRVDILTDPSWLAATRWAVRLGFTRTGLREAIMEDDPGDQIEWVRIRRGVV